MFATAVMTVLCTAGTAFYARFLVALCQVSKPRLIGYRVRLRLGSGEDAMAELQKAQRPSESSCLRTV
jgi:hypothetical protein